MVNILQVQQANGMTVYNNVFDCIKQNYRSGGIVRFYRGMTAKLVRVVPDAAILFVVYEQFKSSFENIQYTSK